VPSQTSGQIIPLKLQRGEGFPHITARNTSANTFAIFAGIAFPVAFSGKMRRFRAFFSQYAATRRFPLSGEWF
jgi:hypothetical protein